MKVYEIRDFGLDSLEVAERPVPKPGYGQVLVKVASVSLNYRDLLVIKGMYSRNLPFPLIPFSDGAGEVCETGEGVTRFKPGDRVAGIFMQRWLAGELSEEKARSALGGSLDGMLAEYVVLHEDGLVHVPEHLSHEEAATLPCAALTAWHAAIEEGLKPGDTVLTLGTGGVSLFALKFARMAGARVIITSGSDEKLAKVREMESADCINYKKTSDWENRVKELTGNRGVDVVVEVGGAGTLPKSLKSVRMGGRVSLIGVLTGADCEVNPLPAVMKSVRIQGILVGSREMFEAMNRAISLHKFRPVIDRVFTFEEAKEALLYMESASHFGKIVVRIY